MNARSVVPVLCALLAVAGCGDKSSTAPSETGGDGNPKPQASQSPKVPLAGLKELKIEDKVVGTGPKAEPGDLVAVLYRGTLADGTEFDSNMDAGAPFSFTMGSGFVIKGWDAGLTGMQVGGERKISIPWEQGYGEQGSPPKIPPRADLFFDVKLLDIVKKGEEQIYDKKDIKIGSGPAAKAGDKVTVHYVGKLVNGIEFDSSRGRGEPFTFTLGANEVVPGFDAGVTGMKAGGVRELKLPPDLAYGSRGNPPSIPPDAKLIFTIELLKIQPGG